MDTEWTDFDLRLEALRLSVELHSGSGSDAKTAIRTAEILVAYLREASDD